MNDPESYSKLVALPDELKKEADDFVAFLKTRMAGQETTKSRIPGLAKGLVKMSSDFDEPPFKEYHSNR